MADADLAWPPLSPGPDPGAAPGPRMGSVAVAVNARLAWGEDLLVVHGGLGEGRWALGDVCVLAAASEAWSRPVPHAAASPPPRAFHAAAPSCRRSWTTCTKTS